MPDHKFRDFRINKEITDSFVDRYAEEYINLRSGGPFEAESLAQSGLVDDLDFDTSTIERLFQRHTMPERIRAIAGDRNSYRDIFRSDLGEMLLTYYFERGIESVTFQSGMEKAFTIPLKNIYDRETNHLPGRGLDLVGYRIEPTLTLLLGEAKASHEKRNPPQVVNQANDSIYHSQKKNKDDSSYLIKRLANFAKKLRGNDFTALSAILLHLDQGNSNGFHTVYGCCLVRDDSCVKVPGDYGKLDSRRAEFEPGEVHFVIPIFELPLHDVVDLFHGAVIRKLDDNV